MGSFFSYQNANAYIPKGAEAFTSKNDQYPAFTLNESIYTKVARGSKIYDSEGNEYIFTDKEVNYPWIFGELDDDRICIPKGTKIFINNTFTILKKSAMVYVNKIKFPYGFYLYQILNNGHISMKYKWDGTEKYYGHAPNEFSLLKKYIPSNENITEVNSNVETHAYPNLAGDDITTFNLGTPNGNVTGLIAGLKFTNPYSQGVNSNVEPPTYPNLTGSNVTTSNFGTPNDNVTETTTGLKFTNPYSQGVNLNVEPPTYTSVNGSNLNLELEYGWAFNTSSDQSHRKLNGPNITTIKIGQENSQRHLKLIPNITKIISHTYSNIFRIICGVMLAYPAIHTINPLISNTLKICLSIIYGFICDEAYIECKNLFEN